jgi:hypothetical protein
MLIVSGALVGGVEIAANAQDNDPKSCVQVYASKSVIQGLQSGRSKI